MELEFKFQKMTSSGGFKDRIYPSDKGDLLREEIENYLLEKVEE